MALVPNCSWIQWICADSLMISDCTKFQVRSQERAAYVHICVHHYHSLCFVFWCIQRHCLKIWEYICCGMNIILLTGYYPWYTMVVSVLNRFSDLKKDMQWLFKFCRKVKWINIFIGTVYLAVFSASIYCQKYIQKKKIVWALVA
jgi:hypothetical protein